MRNFVKYMSKNCIWCFKSENETSFQKKAHSIPRSLGGQNYNKNVCDQCNEHFGNKNSVNRYSIEEALKETFCISRQRFLNRDTAKRQVGEFKSMFFDIKDKNGRLKLEVKRSFKFQPGFQKELCRNFKKGLLKMWFEEFDRQSKHTIGNDEKYNLIRNFARYDIGDIPVVYFTRRIGIFMMFGREAETPVLYFNRMKYLYEDNKFTEIEFLGHVFGFPKSDFSKQDFENYIRNSLNEKKNFFTHGKLIDKLIDVDLSLSILDQ